MRDKKELLWDLSVQATGLSVEINDLRKSITTAINACPRLQLVNGFMDGTPHFHEWFEFAKEENCRVEDLEYFGECHYCKDAYWKMLKRKKLNLERGYLRSRITKLVRGAA